MHSQDGSSNMKKLKEFLENFVGVVSAIQLLWSLAVPMVGAALSYIASVVLGTPPFSLWSMLIALLGGGLVLLGVAAFFWRRSALPPTVTGSATQGAEAAYQVAGGSTFVNNRGRTTGYAKVLKADEGSYVEFNDTRDKR